MFIFFLKIRFKKKYDVEFSMNKLNTSSATSVTTSVSRKRKEIGEATEDGEGHGLYIVRDLVRNLIQESLETLLELAQINE